MKSIVVTAICAVSSLTALPVSAQSGPGGWGNSGWSDRGWNSGRSTPSSRAERVGVRDRSSEGRVEVSSFVAEGDAAKTLGHGIVTVTSRSDSLDGRADSSAGKEVAPVTTSSYPAFEAAVIDRLAAIGYETASRADQGGQTVELRIQRVEVQPEEAKRNPVSGSTTVGVSNHGSMMGMALNVDLRKPLKALWSTQLSAQIRDRTTHEVLWEGRASMRTRDGDPRWSEQAVAQQLAGALFADFPKPISS